MMAKMFYSIEETMSALGKSEEEIKNLTREGRLREFRDGAKRMFKADQVEQLRAEIGGGDAVHLGPSDTGGPIGLADSRGASGSMIGLADSTAGRSSAGSKLEDTSLGNDIGLSGSAGGIPSPGRSRTGSGINILGPDESAADPMAQTAINQSMGDQVNLEGVGSGSGLLDLTRESDDTSLGAELLDEIAPGGAGGTRAGSVAEAGYAAPTALAARSSAAVATPAVVEAPDPLAAAFAGAAAGAAVTALVGLYGLSAGVLGTRPELLQSLVSDGKFNTLYLLGGGAVLSIVLFIVGFVVGKK